MMLGSAKGSANDRRWLSTQVGQRHQVRVELIRLKAVLDFRVIEALCQRSPQCVYIGEVRVGRLPHLIGEDNTPVTELFSGTKHASIGNWEQCGWQPDLG